MSLYTYLSTVVGIDPRRANKLHLSTRQRVTAFGLAIHIPVAVWALTGFVIASQIFNQPIGRSAAIAGMCAGMIYLVERLVIESPTSRWLSAFRLVIGLVVAILGATAVDLVLFDREVAQQLKADGEQRIRLEFDSRLSQAEQALAERKRDWLQAQEAANCEANGTCGTRRASVGPVYRGLVRQADTLRADYTQADKAVVDLRLSREEALKAWSESDTAVNDAGLLARVKALHDYILGDAVALAAWGLFFVLMVLLEMMVVFAKWAFGKTVDDHIETIREELKLHHAQSYRDAITSPGYKVQQLIEAPVSAS
jgi:hypothetical protein